MPVVQHPGGCCLSILTDPPPQAMVQKGLHGLANPAPQAMAQKGLHGSADPRQDDAFLTGPHPLVRQLLLEAPDQAAQLRGLALHGSHVETHLRLRSWRRPTKRK